MSFVVNRQIRRENKEITVFAFDPNRQQKSSIKRVLLTPVARATKPMENRAQKNLQHSG